MNKSIKPENYNLALKEAYTLITAGHEQFLRSASRVSIDLRYAIGQLISMHSTKYNWGEQTLKQFSFDLTAKFPGVAGFSDRNLRAMRQFYESFSGSQENYQLAREVSWRTNMEIISKVKDPAAQKFYLQMAAETMCNRDVISAQISANAYEKQALKDKKHNFNATLPAVQAAKAENILKSNYFFELTEPYIFSSGVLEKKVEAEMVERVKDVIMMLGKGFAYIGNQYPLRGNKDNQYKVDLLFTNRITQSLVAVELKTTKFKAEYASKMTLYLKLLDEQVRLEHENPTIGLILCTDRNDFEVDYVLPDINRPIGVAELNLSKELPAALENALPSPSEIKQRLLDI